MDRWKLLLFETLVKHYSHADRPPLLPAHMTHVYTAITDMLGDLITTVIIIIVMMSLGIRSNITRGLGALPHFTGTHVILVI